MDLALATIGDNARPVREEVSFGSETRRRLPRELRDVTRRDAPSEALPREAENVGGSRGVITYPCGLSPPKNPTGSAGR